MMVNVGIRYADVLMNITLSSAAVMESLGNDFMTAPVEGKKWTKSQIIGHLIDSAYNNHQRLVRTEAQGNMIYDGYDQDHWVQANQYSNREFSEVLDTFIVAQRHLANVIAGLPDEKLTKEYKEHHLHKTAMRSFPANQAGTLSYLVWDYLFHVEHHLKQVIPGYVCVSSPDFYQ